MAFPSGWSYSVARPIDYTKVSALQTDFVVFLSRSALSDQMCDPSFAGHALSTGADIRITTDEAGANQVPVDIVAFALDSATNAADGVCALYAKVPSLSATASTPLYIWYGNSAATAPAVTDTYGRNAVWTGYWGVWHTTSTTELIDATGNGYDCTLTGSAVYGGEWLQQNVDTLRVGSSQSSTYATAQYFSNATPPPITTATYICGYEQGIRGAHDGLLGTCLDSPGYGYGLRCSNTGVSVMSRSGNSGPQYTDATNGNVLQRYVGVIDRESQEVLLYGSGALLGSAAGLGTPWGTSVVIANLHYSGAFREPRIYQGALDAGWVATEYANQSSPSTFFDLSAADVAVGGGGASVSGATATLSSAGLAPTIFVTEHNQARGVTAAGQAQGLAASASTTVTGAVLLPSAQLALNGLAPQAAATEANAVMLPSAQGVAQGRAATAVRSARNTARGVAATAQFLGNNAIVQVGAGNLIVVPQALLAANGETPLAVVTARNTVELVTGGLMLAGLTAQTHTEDPQHVTLKTATLVIKGLAASVTTAATNTIVLPTATFSATGKASATFRTANNVIYLPLGEIGARALGATWVDSTPFTKQRHDARPPTFRTIDMKTLADKFNEGLADAPDYEFSGHRKFYQDRD